MPSKLKMIVALRGNEEYEHFLLALTDRMACRTVSDAVERSIAEAAARLGMSPPRRWSPTRLAVRAVEPGRPRGRPRKKPRENPR
jgi:hypothetical protein